MDEFTTPPPVEPGDQVAVVAPASNGAAAVPHVYELGLERMRQVFDLDPVEYPTATKDAEWLQDHPEARARDLEDAFRDPDVAGVVANIGGHDQIRVLPHLDLDVLADNPTRFYGWSDNTHLALSLWNRGVVSYYGGSTLLEYAMDGAMFDHTVEYLGRALFDDALGEIAPADEFTDQAGDWGDPDALETPRETEPGDGWTWAGGEDAVAGRVWGGCLGSIQDRYVAGRDLPDPAALDGAVLAIETSELVPHEGTVSGVLQGLGERGVLERFAGVLVGRPAARSHDPMYQRDADWRSEFRDRQRDAVTDVLARYNPDAPVVFDLEFGHTYPTTPIPIGGRVEIDPATETIRFP
jgi:muramoyltetrapeptide carboxypeptidase LdcA involved in peptidoglycan recycling